MGSCISANSDSSQILDDIISTQTSLRSSIHTMEREIQLLQSTIEQMSRDQILLQKRVTNLSTNTKVRFISLNQRLQQKSDFN